MELTRIYPQWVYGDREWLSCLMILDCSTLRSKGIVDTYVDFERQRINVAELLEDMRPWSTGERILVQVAIDLFNGDGGVNLKQAVDYLDDQGLGVMLSALCVYGGV